MAKPNKSLDMCFEAFERIKSGKAVNEKHKSLAPSDITPSIVSKEAGFDAGYLKKSRIQHQPLITLINNYAKVEEKPHTVRQRDIKRLKVAKDRSVAEKSNIESMLHKALGRELLLVKQLRTMEKQIKDLQSALNISQIKR